MPEVSVEIEVFCSCGNGICNNTTSGKTRGRGQPYFNVEPCKKCLDAARDEGSDKSYDDGYQAGYEDARKEFEKPNAK